MYCMKNYSIRKAVILAGGKGTRFLPWTAGVSKTMLPLVDKPALHFIVEEMIASGIFDISIVLGSNKDSIIRYFESNRQLLEHNAKIMCHRLDLAYETLKINFCVQKKLQGTADALLTVKPKFKNQNFVVACGDEIYDSKVPVALQLVEQFQNHNCSIIASRRLPKSQATRFGVLQVEKNFGKLTKLKGIIEKPPIEKIDVPLVNLGRYVLNHCIFDEIAKLKPNNKNEYALTDAIQMQSQTQSVLCYEFDGEYFDMGNKNSYVQAFLHYARKHPEIQDFS